KSKEQSEEMKRVFNNMKGYGDLDYVSAWYKKSAEFIKGTKIKAAFVSTNSITQGTQVSILWENLIKDCGVHIHFAHRTFEWNNEAKGKAHVYCVIIGFANFEADKKRLFDYEDIKGEPHEIIAENINPYLIDFENIFIVSRKIPISKVPDAIFDNSPLDDGNFIFETEEEKEEFIKKEPNAEKYIRPLIRSKEYLNNKLSYCLWLENISPAELKKMPLVMERVEKVKQYRLNSTRDATVKLANTPYLFGEIRQPKDNYILIPRVTSERRKYIPFSFFDSNYIPANSCIIIPNAELYHFGVLTSIMHMVWVKYVCGRLKADYRYSKDIVYNNFPWPLSAAPDIKKSIEVSAKAVLDARAMFPDSSLADLYDPLTMPKALIDAHSKLDAEVDKAYGVKKNELKNESDRIKFLFKMYEKYIDNL
ncbi:type IIL restriction-modification enzyme MmeI, partial [Brachyspira pilosicoli]